MLHALREAGSFLAQSLIIDALCEGSRVLRLPNCRCRRSNTLTNDDAATEGQGLLKEEERLKNAERQEWLEPQRMLKITAAVHVAAAPQSDRLPAILVGQAL